MTAGQKTPTWKDADLPVGYQVRIPGQDGALHFKRIGNDPCNDAPEDVTVDGGVADGDGTSPSVNDARNASQLGGQPRHLHIAGKIGNEHTHLLFAEYADNADKLQGIQETQVGDPELMTGNAVFSHPLGKRTAGG